MKNYQMMTNYVMSIKGIGYIKAKQNQLSLDTLESTDIPENINDDIGDDVRVDNEIEDSSSSFFVNDELRDSLMKCDFYK